MIKAVFLLAVSAWVTAGFAFADDYTTHSSAANCCLSIQGQTAEVLVAPNADAVRRIQAELAVRGFDPGPIDGVLGPRTNRALRTFQRDQGLLEGLLSIETLSRLGIAIHRNPTTRINRLQGASRLAGAQAHHTSRCCQTDAGAGTSTVTRRVVRRQHTSGPASAHTPDQPAVQRLPNYVSATTRHEVEALSWPGQSPR